MEPQSVDSTMVKTVAYDPETQKLEVLFTSGKTYVYSNVPQEIYDELMAAESKGSYMRANIIDMYPTKEKSN